MERVTTILIIYAMVCIIQCFPIENGFTVKFNPLSPRDELSAKDFGSLFAKVPQEGKEGDRSSRDVFNKGFFPRSFDLGAGHTNQVAKLTVPGLVPIDYNITGTWQNINLNFLNLPVISQPFSDYKVLVATAPPNINIASGTDMKKTVVYIVFPDDGSNEQEISIMPKIYFVNENGAGKNIKKQVVDPILIIDSNRTVTGLKSKEIAKFLRFRNKLTNRFNYEIMR